MATTNKKSISKLIHLYKTDIEKAILIRCVENKFLDLYSQGFLNGTVHTCVGQEFAAIFINKYLLEEDHIVSNHRGHGHYISRFNDLKGLISEVMGKPSGCSGGIGGSQHLVNKNYLSNGIQGGMVPIAAGVALDMKIKKINNISVAFIGDGTLGEGVLYETLNIASNWNLPFLVVLENNGYAQSTSHKQTFSGSIKNIIEGFNIKYYEADTWDIENLDKIAMEAIENTRNNRMPSFFQIKTSRLNSHSKGDDNRSENEVEKYKKNDLLNQIFAKNFSSINKIRKKIENNIDDLVEDIKKQDSIIIRKNKEVINYKSNDVDNNLINKKSRKYNDEIYETLKSNFVNNDNLLMIGEDIENNNKYNSKPYGGAFKVTRDLSNLFEGRVLNTPISEASIVGVALGFSIRKNISIVEIMFGDFTTLIFDQILQHASKFEYMFNGKVKCPLIIRTPMGGKRGYGPTHSQSIEKHFIGIPNIALVVLNHRLSPKVVYDSIINHYKSPFIVIENKVLYTRSINEPFIPGYNYILSNNLFPSLLISPKNIDVSLTIACYGELLFDIERAVKEIIEEEEFVCEIICETMISPVQFDVIKKSVISTKKLLIVEEGSNEAAWSSEIIAKLIENDITDFDKISRISNNHIIPAELNSELAAIPNVDMIKSKIKEFIK